MYFQLACMTCKEQETGNTKWANCLRLESTTLCGAVENTNQTLYVVVKRLQGGSRTERARAQWKQETILGMTVNRKSD